MIVVFLLVVIAALVLGILGVLVHGLFYLLIIGVILLLADVALLAVRSADPARAGSQPRWSATCW